MRQFSLSILTLSLILFFGFVTISIAKDVYVDGYYRKDGTYVRPHYRSSPNSSTSDNYGPSRSDSEYLNPYARDNDEDGTPNTSDYDDDNDGVYDDYDSSQYGR